MKFSYFLPFVGLSQAVPAANPSHPSIFDNPTIPLGDPASIEDLPGLSHVRRAAAATQPTLNVTFCDVTVKGDTGFYQAWKPQETKGHLYITQGIPSPGTKNGDNIYDVYLQAGPAFYGGYISFTTNKYLLPLPYKVGPSNVDYVKVSMSKKGYILSEVDYSNIDKPEVNSPLVFYTEQSKNFGETYERPTKQLAYGQSYLAVKIGDKGIVDGVLQLIRSPEGGLGYVARITGVCWIYPTRVPVAL